MEHAHEQGSDDLAQLAAQSAWARRLAIALARDVQAGEDIAQEALLATVRARPTGDVRGWLARVIRNLARLRRRTEGRRGARERLALPEHLPDDPALALQRIELQEALLGAVRALPEPYRNTILLRWFEELEPEEIARRTNTPVRTVHTRLHRALALLREELDRRSQGDRSRWLAAWLPLLPLPHSPLPWAFAMQAKTKLAVAVVSVAAVASLWLALRPLSSTHGEFAAPPAKENVVLETEHGASGATKSGFSAGDRTAIDTSASAGSIAVAKLSGLSVRSSIGLELPFLEWQTPLGDWQRRDLTRGRCASTDLQFPCRIRAPGHVPVTAANAGTELVLEPDELLILEGHDLQSCTSSIRIGWPYHYEDDPGEPCSGNMQCACMSGYLSADRWAMAVNHELLLQTLDEDAPVVVLWRDGHRADLHLKPVAGLRGNWTVPCDGRPACAPLTLHVQRPSGSPAGPITLKVVHPRTGESGQPTLETLDWGSAVTYESDVIWAEDVRIAPDANEYSYSALRLGEPLLFFARDETSGAYGRAKFEHDGSARTISLRPAFELVLRLVTADDASPITDAHVWWEFPDGKDQVWGWHCGDGRTSHAADGVFRRLLPESPLLREEEPLEVPPTIHVHVEAVGFEAWDKRYETSGAQRLDCGDLRLIPKAGQLVLAPGHGLGPRNVDDGTLRVSASPEINWSVRGGVSSGDGSLTIYLDESEDSKRNAPRFRAQSFLTDSWTSAPWPAPQSAWLVLDVMDEKVEGPWLFERQADGRFAAAARSEREIVFQCDALPPLDTPHVTWCIGWMSHDQWGIIRGSSWQVGMVERMRVTFPAGGASIYWSAKGPPPGVLGAPKEIGGSIPVEEINGKVLLK